MSEAPSGLRKYELYEVVQIRFEVFPLQLGNAKNSFSTKRIVDSKFIF
jgi:hypothetical protein